MTCLRSCFIFLAALAALRPALAQDEPATKRADKSDKNGVVVVEHGDDRIEVRFVPGAARPTVLINGKRVGADHWRVDDGEHAVQAGEYRLRLKTPAGGWLSPSLLGLVNTPFPYTARSSDLANSRDYLARFARAGEKRPYIGVQVGPVTPALAEHLQLDPQQCVLVVSTTEDGPAAKAGMRAHDILVAIDGVDGVTDGKLSEAVDGKKPGAKLVVGILRRGKAQDLAVEIGEETKTNWLAHAWPHGAWERDLALAKDSWVYTVPEWRGLTADAFGEFVRQRTEAAKDEGTGERSGSGLGELRQQLDAIRKLVEQLEKRLAGQQDGGGGK